MIVKNGERFIKAQLEHILPYVDELIVNISGIDNTKEIVKDYWMKNPDKIRIYYNTVFDSIATENGREWFDEGVLRNWVKNKCTGDWIIQQDVDEFYDEDFLKNMRTILSETKHLGLFFPKLNFWKSFKEYRIDGNWYPDIGGVKIFRHNPSILYTGGKHGTIGADFGKSMFSPTTENLMNQYPILHFARAVYKPIGEEGSPEMLDETKLQTALYEKTLPFAVELIKGD
jgi:hypothetical protein